MRYGKILTVTLAFLALLIPARSIPADPINVSQSAYACANPRVAVDASGVVHVAWKDSTTGSIYYRQIIAGVLGPVETVFSLSNLGFLKFDMVVSSQGTVTIVRDHSGYGCLYTRQRINSIWGSVQENCDDDPFFPEPYTLDDLEIDSLDQLHLLLNKGTGCPSLNYADYADYVGWTNFYQVDSACASKANLFSAKLAADFNARMAAVYSKLEYYGDSYADLYVSFPTQGSLFPAGLLDHEVFYGWYAPFEFPQVAISSYGYIHTMYTFMGSLRYFTNEPGASPPSITQGACLDMRGDALNRIHALISNFEDQKIYYIMQYLSIWTEPLLIANPATNDWSRNEATLAIDNLGSVHMAWKGDYSTLAQIYYYNPTLVVLDSDNDGLDDNLENYFHTDPHDPDSDDDGLGDGPEVLTYHTGPLDPDSDDDGLLDGDEVALGANPLDWDTDGDALPDGWEVSHGFNPIIPDGDVDADQDGNPVAHELFNGTSDQVADPHGQAGACYYGDADGDAVVGPQDSLRLQQVAIGIRTICPGPWPDTCDTLDLDGDYTVGPGDFTVIQKMIVSLDTETAGGNPSELQILSLPAATLAVGATTHFTVHAYNLNWHYTSGIGLVFRALPSSIGQVTLLGGDGALGNDRYDITGARAGSAAANIVIRGDSPGAVSLDVWLPETGVPNHGRHVPELHLASPVVINVE